jgi:hypothetical protein
MLILTKATITPEGDGAALALQDEENNGRYRVVHSGASVTISVRDEKGRHRRVDQIINAEVSGPKGRDQSYTVEGISTNLVDVVKLNYDESRVTFGVHGQDGCPSCH